MTNAAAPFFHVVLILLVVVLHSPLTLCLRHCPLDEGGGVCPDNNTCCPTLQPGVSSCITHAHKDTREGVCCNDDNGMGKTGCPPGYKCSFTVAYRDHDDDHDDDDDGKGQGTVQTMEKIHYFCEKDEEEEGQQKPKWGTLPNGKERSTASTSTNSAVIPRYHLCTMTESQLGDVYGLPITLPTVQPARNSIVPHQNDNGSYNQNSRDDESKEPSSSSSTSSSSSPLLAYQSNMGSITSRTTLSQHQAVQIVLIIVHGSERNADDYLCSVYSAASLQNVYPMENILIITPRFLAVEDGDVNVTTTTTTATTTTETMSNNSKKTNGGIISTMTELQESVDDDRSTADYPNEKPSISTTTSNAEKTSSLLLRWNETYPIPHTWRYGADSLPFATTTTTASTYLNSKKNDASSPSSSSSSSSVSSYEAMDQLVEYVMFHVERFPNLQRIVVAGHSAGGQFTQRWALTSGSKAWKESFDHDEHHDDDDHHDNSDNVDRDVLQNVPNADKKRIVNSNDELDVPTLSFPRGAREENGRLRKWQRQTMQGRRGTDDGFNNNSNNNKKQERRLRKVPIHLVVANPRSFCYLDGKRYDITRHRFRIPNQDDIASCPGYNQWEWGLDNGGRLVAPYRDHALALLHGNVTQLIFRYASRSVLYLAGENDTELLRSSCEDDDFQGRYRLERSKWFYDSLLNYFHGEQGMVHHERVVVKDVGHDHCLMFQSDVGIKALFGRN